MHILLLGAGLSVHCIKIANGLVDLGHKVTIATLSKHMKNMDSYDPRVQIRPLQGSHYFGQGKRTASLFQEIGADIAYAHYATGYGLILRNSGIHPSVLAIWGSDIYDFPRTSFVHRWFIKRNLAYPDAVFSTSHVMARVAQEYLDRPLRITPFGVDMRRFAPAAETLQESLIREDGSPFLPETLAQLPAEDGKIHIGFIKGLDDKYGLSYLLEAFARIQKDKIVLQGGRELVLDIYGSGQQEMQRKAQAAQLGLQGKAIFHGRIPNHAVPAALRRMQLFCAPSTLDSESFGVSAVEAMACGVPLIVSDVDGFREVTENGRYADMVKRSDVLAIAEAILRFLKEPDKARCLAREARDHVRKCYDWQDNIQNIADGLEAVANGREWMRREDEWGLAEK